ncbi:TIGR04086 family membrane protein [Alicyclobacillus vulcanalis]|uniref:Putative membrane protein, TIGR04086 family n=1 Tax=Alicyclobacillus vulcanalis TaxID=252246 RepID=A0A1N7P964_9BACL|nr:TIGR04086 family membrane protein [Alicyclobacillus vulcanalis]SIT07132.1 putative membrane protein, TIGR04086 family [Alicyclobacillus vulcanalis]
MSRWNEGQRFDVLRAIPVVYGIVWSLCIALCGTLVVFLMAHYGEWSPERITTAAYVVHCIAVMWGAIAAARQAQGHGWFHGGATGLIYAILMVAIGLVVDNTFTFDASGLFRILLMSVIGAFGGVMGNAWTRS